MLIEVLLVGSPNIGDLLRFCIAGRGQNLGWGKFRMKNNIIILTATDWYGYMLFIRKTYAFTQHHTPSLYLFTSIDPFMGITEN